MLTLKKALSEFGQVKHNYPLAKFTTIKIGGAAELFIEVSERQKLSGLLNFLAGEGLDYFMLGGGSNILLPDDGLSGVVIKIKDNYLTIYEDATIEASAGAPLSVVVMSALRGNLTGLEWAMGLPGTVGGAVRGNAGATWIGLACGETAGLLTKVEVWRDGEVFQLAVSECDYSYRESIFKHNQDVILRAWFKLVPGDSKKSLPVMQEILKRRQGHYPTLPSSGSFFKNIPLDQWKGSTDQVPADALSLKKIPAGWLIDQAGMKGFQVGGSGVSKEHANFLVNFKGATQAEMLQVIAQVKEAVYTKFGVQLEEEVQILN